jgi:hypothetical protein
MMNNDNLTNRELSAEELEAVAAGWPHWLHSAVNWVEHEVSTAVHYAVPVIEKIIKIIAQDPKHPGPGKYPF